MPAAAPATSAPAGPVAPPAPPAAKKAAAKAPAKTRAKAAAPASPAAPAVRKRAAPAKSPKQRPKLVRDSFTMPESDFALIAKLKARALAGQRAAKKSELIRAGLQALQALDAAGLAAALDRLEPIKTGRPKKH